MNILIYLTLLAGLWAACSEPNNKAEGKTLDGWSLVWQDEFDGVHVNEAKWNYEQGGNGWGNNELQYYTNRPENVFVENGTLIIRALEEKYKDRDYTSARLTTKLKGDWLYGKIEVRAKLPEGRGLWPAIWMLPTNWEYGGWAASGEIDIMELIGHEPSTVYGTLHYGGEHPNNVHTGTKYTLPSDKKFSDNFHLFSIEWEKNEIRWYVDELLYQSQTEWYSSNGEYPAPFDKRFHLLLNIAVGGNWPGSPDASTHFPQCMVVDYVRIYKRTDME